MTPETITNFLPPIVLSIGGILPFMVASPPFSVPSNAQPLLVCLLTLVIWTGYWAAYLFGQWAFNSESLTMGLLIASFLSLGVVFYVAKMPSIPRLSAAGQPIRDSAGNAITDAPVDRSWPIWFYVAGLLTISIAAALYVGPKDRVLVTLRIPPDKLRNDYAISKVERTASQGSFVSLDSYSKNHSEVEFFMTKSELDSVETFQITVNGSGAVQYWLADRKSMFDQLGPGLARRVCIFAYHSDEPKAAD